MCIRDSVQVFQLFLVPGRWEKAVVAVPVEAPLLGQKMRHDVAAGDDVEDVALAPALFQAAVGVVVVVVILLQVGIVLRAEGHRCRKGVDENILPFQSGQLPVDPGSQKVRHHRTRPLHLDISDEPMKKGIITNRNKFVLGGSGFLFFINFALGKQRRNNINRIFINNLTNKL